MGRKNVNQELFPCRFDTSGPRMPCLVTKISPCGKGSSRNCVFLEYFDDIVESGMRDDYDSGCNIWGAMCISLALSESGTPVQSTNLQGREVACDISPNLELRQTCPIVQGTILGSRHPSASRKLLQLLHGYW